MHFFLDGATLFLPLSQRESAKKREVDFGEQGAPGGTWPLLETRLQVLEGGGDQGPLWKTQEETEAGE